jgi:hypothetical protein
VDKETGAGGDGSSWANAYTELRDALNDAEQYDEIWVAAEVYKPGENLTDSFNLEAY